MSVLLELLLARKTSILVNKFCKVKVLLILSKLIFRNAFSQKVEFPNLY